MKSNRLIRFFNLQTKVLLGIIAIGLVLVCILSFLAINALKYEYDTTFTKYIQEIKTLKSMQDFYSIHSNTHLEFDEFKQALTKSNRSNTFDFLHHTYQKIFLHSSYEKLFQLNQEKKVILDTVEQEILVLDTLLLQHDNGKKNILDENTLLRQQAKKIQNLIAQIIDLRLQIATIQSRSIHSIFIFTSIILFFCMFIVFLTTISLCNHILKSIKKHEEELCQVIKDKTLQLENINKNLKKTISKEVESSRKKDQIMYQQDRLASMGEMIQNIAHQWRQPLNSLIVLIQSFKTKFYNGKLDENFINTQTEDGLKIAKSMSETIENFRHFFQPNKLKSSFSIIESIEDSIKLIDFVLKQNNITIHRDYSEDFEFYGYKNAFTQVVLNILKNAQDAIIEQKIPQGHCCVILKKKYDKITIIIQDNAGGIKQKSLYKIFEPYFTTKHKSTGTGIGLYMTKEIIEKQMQGTISAHNMQWHIAGEEQSFYGASFIIELPCTTNKNF
ncbi:HAMP domain-containing histidine kinase [Helicobacter sp. faydin-H20]|uniref:sensor histidine kinase n=1 Tax=Helicobacter anatolicus TaxID=2905874 RepID=UPI001E2A169D|nr:HAMP domain-containing sensor histidine kinase [Helicobacter anatolicus]MCE3037602.1 HAMP domain-containing histidine kinase [Helicobacter anatolicus]